MGSVSAGKERESARERERERSIVTKRGTRIKTRHCEARSLIDSGTSSAGGSHQFERGAGLVRHLVAAPHNAAGLQPADYNSEHPGAWARLRVPCEAVPKRALAHVEEGRR